MLVSVSFAVSLALWLATPVLARTVPLAVSEPAEHALGDEPLSVAVRLPAAVADEPRRLRVVVEGLELVRQGAVHEVYLNLPDGERPDPESRYFLGNVALFGAPRENGPGSRRGFDITEQVAALRADGEWTGEIELTFVRGNAEPVPASIGPEDYIRFTHISVFERPPF